MGKSEIVSVGGRETSRLTVYPPSPNPLNNTQQVCPDCDAEFMRPYHVRRNRKRTGRRRGAHRHATGNTCDACGTGELRDTVVAFGEPMPPQETIDAFDASARAHLSIVLGTSMRVNPAAQVRSPREVASGSVGKQ